ncbi:MAG: endonuclease [Prolixibacteraceae bacterium]|nr:endonuclease [Prolixibacteraceae bacterium]
MRNTFTAIITGLLILFTFSIYAQIPEGYYDITEGLSGEQLKTTLHNIIRNHTEYPYTSSSTDTWDILKETDRDTINPDNVILIYSGWSVNAAQEYNNGNGWNREHIWAKSHGDFETTGGAGTDIHHLRPSDISVNLARDNKDYDNGGTLYIDNDGPTECYTDADSWEPRDAVKGDVARMLFYMAVRYEGDGSEPDLELVDAVNTDMLNEPGKGYFGKLSVLLQWNEEDPVDSFEIRRNDVIYSYQHNRNPFIDHPEFVTQIWDSETGAGEFTNQNNIKIYPNPAKSEINFSLKKGESGLLTIFNANGEIIIKSEIAGEFSLSTDHFCSGFYFINFINSKGSIFNAKQIVVK